MPTSIETLQSAIDKINQLAASAEMAKPKVAELTKLLQEQMARHGGAAFPKEQWLRDIDTVIKVLESMPGAVGLSWRQAMAGVRQEILQVGQIYRQSFTTGIGIGAQIPVAMPTKTAQLIGGISAFERLAATMPTSIDLQTSLAAALGDVGQKYGALGYEIKGTTVVLDVANQAWEIQANLLKQVGANLSVAATAQERYGVTTGKILEPTALQQELTSRLGPERLVQFERQLSSMGLSLTNLRNVQVDAVNGIARFSFMTTEASGAVRTANFHIDQWGRLLGDTSTRFRSFDDMIARNITKVLQWAIAVGVVYGAWRQAQEMLRQMGDIQESMADLAIVTGESMTAMGQYFDRTAEIARETGTDISDVFKATDEAMRATGGMAQTERAAAAFDLLGDAATYAKLTGIDTARAVDLLVASLRQMGMALTEGDQLLNKWVAVSRQAHVSLLDFGEAFSTTAAAAADVGVGVDVLNGLIAAMSEVTGLAPQEAANALRALFGALQTDQAVEALQQYGIAVKDADGRTRNFEDILYDIYKAQLEVNGVTLLGTEAINDLGYAMGGQGVRRGAQMTAIFQNLGRAYEASNVSAEATTELQDAMEIKTATLDTAVDRLKNAFTEWAEVMGTEGGILDMLTNIAKAMTEITKLASGVGSALGAAGTGAAVFLGAWGLGTRFAVPQRLGALGGGGGALSGTAALGMMGGGAAGGGLAAGLTQYGPAAMYGGVAGLGVGLATGSAAQGIGAAIGAAFGYTAGGPIGGMIGTVIGTAFGSTIDDMVPIWKQELGLAPRPEITGMTEEQIRQEIETRVWGPGTLGNITSLATAAALSVAQRLQTMTQYRQTAWGYGAGVTGRAPGTELTYATRDQMLRLIGLTPEGPMRDWLKARMVLGEAFSQFRMTQSEVLRTTDLLLEQQKRYQEAIGETTAVTAELTPADIRRRQLLQMYGAGLEIQMAQRRRELPLEFARGDIASAKEYNTQVQHTYEITDRLLSIFYAMETSAGALGERLGDTGKEFRQLGVEMVSWSDESLQFIQDQALALIQLQEQGQATTDAYQRFSTLLQGIRREERLRQLPELPGFIDLREVEERTGQSIDIILEQARGLQQQFIEQLGIPPEVLQTIDDWVMYFESGAGDAFGTVEGLSRQFVDAIIQDMEKIKQAQDEAFNVRRLKEVDPSKMAEIARANRYWLEYMARLKGMSAQQYLQMEGQRFNLILGPGNVLQQIYSTNEAMLFTLQDILDTEEKQLEGMWNIPSGATFWVPITSLFYQKGGAGAGFPELPELIPPTNRTANATEETALQTATINATLLQMLQKAGMPMQIIEYAGQIMSRGFVQGPEVARQAIKQWQYEGLDPLRDLLEKKALVESVLFGRGTTEERRMPYLPTILREYEAPTIQAPVEVEVPPIKGDFTIQNQITLDGRVIASYVNKIVSQALTSVLRATKGTTKRVR